VHGQEFFREKIMAGNESLASQKSVPELWPGSGIPEPAWWNPDGLLGGIKDMGGEQEPLE
jgi:hypothetical protein